MKTKETLRGNAYEFINNMTCFSRLLNEELKSKSWFVKVMCAKEIDSYFHDYKSKFTLKIVGDGFTVTANFYNNYGDLELDYKVRNGRKVVDRHNCSYSGGQNFEWETTTPQRAYSSMIKDIRTYLNEL